MGRGALSTPHQGIGTVGDIINRSAPSLVDGCELLLVRARRALLSMATMDTYPASNAIAQPPAAGIVDDEVPAKQPVPTGGKRCFVNNLAWRTSWQDLKDHFRGNGTVVFANVIRDQAGNACLTVWFVSTCVHLARSDFFTTCQWCSGRSKGWGIVEFTTPAEVRCGDSRNCINEICLLSCRIRGASVCFSGHVGWDLLSPVAVFLACLAACTAIL